jgi:ankyrin repeat protein
MELIEACKKGDLNFVRSLVENSSNSADINSKDNCGRTSLLWASIERDLEIVKYLIDKGADINHKDVKGETSLMWASQEGHLEIVKYLIEKGADVNHKDDFDGNTSLIWASSFGHLETVMYLIGVPGIELEVNGTRFTEYLPECDICGEEKEIYTFDCFHCYCKDCVIVIKI